MIRKKWKIRFLTTSSLVILSACNAGNVSISTVPQPSSAPAAPVAQRSESGSIAASNPTVFFERIRVRSGFDLKIDGIGFLPSNSSTTNPFAFSLPAQVSISENPVIEPVDQGLAFFKGAGSKLQIEYLDPINFSTKILADNLRSSLFAVSQDLSTTLVENSENAILQTQLGSNSSQNFNLPGEKLNRLISVPEHSEWLVVTNQEIVWLTSTSNAPLKEFDATQVAASSDGDQFLLVGKNGVGIYNRQTQSLVQVPELDSSIQEPALSGNSVAFWQSINGESELYVFDLVSRQKTKVVDLGTESFTDGMICPKWKNGQLYFANFNTQNWEIDRADLSAGNPKVIPFATSDDSRFGFICPQTLDGHALDHE
jgi:hypothetical protein